MPILGITMPTREEHAAAAEAMVQKYVPKFKRHPKADSALMRLLGVILGWFGMKTFMEDFSTTLGYTAYLTENHMNRIGVIFHEGRHAYQGKKYTRLGQGTLYLLPQLVAILTIFACLTLVGFSLSGFAWAWWPTVFLLLFAAPLPAYWRMKFEFDAYCISMAVRYWCRGAVEGVYIEQLIDNFVNMNYYLMWPFKGWLRKRFLRKLKWIKSPQMVNDPYFLAVHRCIERQGLLRRPVA